MSEVYVADLEQHLVVKESINEIFEPLKGIQELLNSFSDVARVIGTQVKEIVENAIKFIREFIESINRYIRQMYAISLEVELATQYVDQDFSPRSPPGEQTFKDKVETYYIWFNMFYLNPFLNYLFKISIDNVVWFVFMYLLNFICGMH